MPASDTFVIAGGGLAGAKAAEALRQQGFGGRIVLACEEDVRPYERPPLSKGYLQGKAGRETIFVHSPDWYDASRVELLSGTAVTGIDRSRREVTLSDGERPAWLGNPGRADGSSGISASRIAAAARELLKN